MGLIWKMLMDLELSSGDRSYWISALIPESASVAVTLSTEVPTGAASEIILVYL